MLVKLGALLSDEESDISARQIVVVLMVVLMFHPIVVCRKQKNQID